MVPITRLLEVIELRRLGAEEEDGMVEVAVVVVTIEDIGMDVDGIDVVVVVPLRIGS